MKCQQSLCPTIESTFIYYVLCFNGPPTFRYSFDIVNRLAIYTSEILFQFLSQEEKKWWLQVEFRKYGR